MFQILLPRSLPTLYFVDTDSSGLGWSVLSAELLNLLLSLLFLTPEPDPSPQLCFLPDIVRVFPSLPTLDTFPDLRDRPAADRKKEDRQRSRSSTPISFDSTFSSFFPSIVIRLHLPPRSLSHGLRLLLLRRRLYTTFFADLRATETHCGHLLYASTRRLPFSIRPAVHLPEQQSEEGWDDLQFDFDLHGRLHRYEYPVSAFDQEEGSETGRAQKGAGTELS